MSEPKSSSGRRWIKNWPESERPREKLSHLGPEALSDGELLAVLLRIGTSGQSAEDLGRQLLTQFDEILPKVSAQEELIFEISELRIRWNSGCGWDEKLFWFQHYLPEYLKLDFPARYLALKEVFNILRDLAKVNNLGPFVGLFSKLMAFMGQSKEEIERYLLVLPDYCVYERCSWEKEKAFLRRIQKVDETQISLIDFYEGMFEHLCNIKDIQLQHGNPLQAIEADLDIADECMGVAQEIRDGIVIDYLRKNLREHLDDACKDLEKFRRHPASKAYLVRIAKYALFLGSRERAKEYFNDFVRSKVSIDHYAFWIQRYYIGRVYSRNVIYNNTVKT